MSQYLLHITGWHPESQVRLNNEIVFEATDKYSAIISGAQQVINKYTDYCVTNVCIYDLIINIGNDNGIVMGVSGKCHLSWCGLKSKTENKQEIGFRSLEEIVEEAKKTRIISNDYMFGLAHII